MTESMTRQQKWNAAHPQATRIANDRSAAKRFIQRYATMEELDGIEAIIKAQRSVLQKRAEDAIKPLEHYSQIYDMSFATAPKGFGVIVSEDVLTASYDDKFLVMTPQRSNLDPISLDWKKRDQLEDDHLHAWSDWAWKQPRMRSGSPVFTAFPLKMRAEVEEELGKQFGYKPILKLRYSADAFSKHEQGTFYYPFSKDPVIFWEGTWRVYRPAKGTEVVSGNLSVDKDKPWAEGHPPVLESEVLRPEYEALSKAQRHMYVPIDEAPALKPRKYRAIKITHRTQKDGTEKEYRKDAGRYEGLRYADAYKAYQAEHPHANLDNIEFEEIWLCVKWC